jgi:H+/Cl- antiporter ClcA
MSNPVEASTADAMRPSPSGESCRPQARHLFLASLGAVPLGVLCGCGAALFLWLLDAATTTREETTWLVWLLPLAGWLLGHGMETWGRSVAGGTHLIHRALIAGGERLPLRMAPIVVLGTVWTHLFGGSAGREGTAVQMGTALADEVARVVRASDEVRHLLLIAGVAGGFGAVFGTPWAGVVFAVEWVRVFRVRWVGVPAAIVAAFVGDGVVHAWGIPHTEYPAIEPLALDASLAARWVLVGAAMAAATVAFVVGTQALRQFLSLHVTRLSSRLFVGGCLVVLLWQGVGTTDYLGLGVPTILRAFEDPDLAATVFAWKLLFTAVTLGAGFLGGEVTPLFFVGATLGSVLAGALGIPIALGAAVGLAAVFAAAANAPLALIVMAVELMGTETLPHVAIVCAVAFLFSGRRGIYLAQGWAGDKPGTRLWRMLATRWVPAHRD